MKRRFGPYKLQPSNVVTLPKEVAESLFLHPGDLFVWIIEKKRVSIRKAFIAIENGQAVGVDIQ